MDSELAGTWEGGRTTDDDASIVRRVLAGERDLYRVLVERYDRRLFWSCRRLLGDPDEAEDVVQESFVRAYQHLAEYDPGRRFFTWIYAIGRHRCLNALRRRKVWGLRRLVAPGEVAVESEIGEEALPAPDDAASLVESRELARALAACLGALPDEQRACFELRHGEEFSYAEIASVLGIPPGTVMSRLARAREKMRACLQTRGVEGIG